MDLKQERLQAEDGQILVLTAFVFIFMLFLLALILAAGQYQTAQAQMEKAAQLGARAGALELGSRMSFNCPPPATCPPPKMNEWDSFIDGLVAVTGKDGAAQQVAVLNGADPDGLQIVL